MEAATAKSKPNNRVKISISISPALLARVDRLAEELELPRSTIVQIALREHLKPQEDS